MFCRGGEVVDLIKTPATAVPAATERSARLQGPSGAGLRPWGGRHDRRASPRRHADRLRRRCVLQQPRDLGDARRRRAGCRPGGARRALPVRGNRDRAADGYGRMTGRPAAVLLHLGPGLANGLANLHNARRARTPLLAIVGDHATYHKRFDAPLESDIEALAGTVSGWVRRSARSADAA